MIVVIVTEKESVRIFFFYLGIFSHVAIRHIYGKGGSDNSHSPLFFQKALGNS